MYSKLWLENLKGRYPLEGWEDNIRIDLREIGSNGRVL
jgi:hypothetical protein